MNPKRTIQKAKRGRRRFSGKVLMKERLRKDNISIAKLPSGHVFTKPRKQLDDCFDRIHRTLVTKGRRKILPESMTQIIEQDVYRNLENRLKELSPSTPSGLVYLALSLGVSLNLSIGIKQPDQVLFDTCVILPRGAPMVLSVVGDKTRQTDACCKYNLCLTKALIQALRQFTNENFSALYGVLTPKDLTSQEEFKKTCNRIEENSSFFCIPESLSMSDRKYEGITKAFFAVAASTNVVQMMCSDDDTDGEKEQLWFLTKEQFVVLSENIDRSTVTVSASPDTGSTVLMLEVASRLEKSGNTLLVSSSEDLCKKARKKKLCSDIMTHEKFRSRDRVPARVKHVVCEGPWSLESVRVGNVWRFEKLSDKSKERHAFEDHTSFIETPPCSPNCGQQ